MTVPIFELTYQRQKVSRVPTELPGRPAIVNTYINRHIGTPSKTKTIDTMSLDHRLQRSTKNLFMAFNRVPRW